MALWKARSGTELDVIQNDTNASGNLTIGSVIADNTSATALAKSGNGTLVLTGANTYTGTTYINAGTLNLGVAEIAGASGPLGNRPRAIQAPSYLTVARCNILLRIRTTTPVASAPPPISSTLSIPMARR